MVEEQTMLKCKKSKITYLIIYTGARNTYTLKLEHLHPHDVKLNIEIKPIVVEIFFNNFIYKN